MTIKPTRKIFAASIAVLLIAASGSSYAKSPTIPQSDAQLKELLFPTDAKGNQILIQTVEVDTQTKKKKHVFRKRAKAKAEKEAAKARAQKAQPKPEATPWALLDSKADGKEGTSTERLYNQYKLPSDTKDIIVAVVDGGVDPLHEDLPMWTNPGEIPGDGIDNDHNGYIDDVHGWNFLGKVNDTTLEITREYVRLQKLEQTSGLNTEQRAYFKAVKSDYDAKVKDTQNRLARAKKIQDGFKTLAAAGLKEETVAAIDALESQDPAVLAIKPWVRSAAELGIDSKAIQGSVEAYQERIDSWYNVNKTIGTVAGDIEGDNPDDVNQRVYGDNDVAGPDPLHGTHVAGIIGAIRGNGIGTRGQSEHVKIMAVRVVPNGDERDKDVANGIRYAVDNGAKVINGSFGKSYSRYPEIVQEAMAYANSKGVVINLAAGNDAQNRESGEYSHFPKPFYKDANGNETRLPNVIVVGANDQTRGNKLPATFSNYGATEVDVFAPGVAIFSTIPGNEYAKLQGTSMASPEVAGIAAVLLNYFPNLNATQIRDVIRGSAESRSNDVIQTPNKDKNFYGTLINARTFGELSNTGGIANAFNAVEYVVNHGLGKLSQNSSSK